MSPSGYDELRFEMCEEYFHSERQQKESSKMRASFYREGSARVSIRIRFFPWNLIEQKTNLNRRKLTSPKVKLNFKQPRSFPGSLVCRAPSASAAFVQTGAAEDDLRILKNPSSNASASAIRARKSVACTTPSVHLKPRRANEAHYLLSEDRSGDEKGFFKFPFIYSNCELFHCEKRRKMI